jgi:hypothetical protein
MSKQRHYIKILPEYYNAIDQGKKSFEVRFNDRNYQVNDILHLQEWTDGEYTGREMEVEVTYLLDDPDYCKDGYVIMAINPCKRL